MKKLLLVALVMGSIYIFILRAVANFITRDTPEYLEALKVTNEESQQSTDAQIRKEFLHRQTLSELIELLCESSPDSESCLADSDEQAFLVLEVAKIEDILQLEPENNLAGTFFNKDKIKPDREQLVYDIWYKRVVTDILLYRERQIPFLSASEQTSQSKIAFSRPAKGRFADYEDITPLLKSFGVGTCLLLAIHFLLPALSKEEVVKSSKVKES